MPTFSVSRADSANEQPEQSKETAGGSSSCKFSDVSLFAIRCSNQVEL